MNAWFSWFDAASWPGGAVLDGSTVVVGLAINWILQSTLLIACGILVAALLRARGSAVQSVVYRTTLAAVLACPIVGWGLSQAGFSGWSVAMPAGRTAEPNNQLIKVDEGATVGTLYGTRELPSQSLDPNWVPPSGLQNDSTQGVLRDGVFPNGAIDELPISNQGDPPLARTPEQQALAEAEQNQTVITVPLEQPAIVRASWFGIAAVIASAAWLALTLLLISRLAIAWWRLTRLRKEASLASEETHRFCEEVAASMAVPAPEVRCSPYLPSPCLAGLRRPTILLPDTPLTMPLRDVLVHELAHVARNDCLWNLLRQVATSLFFFQPLLWILSRQIEQTAEEVCDDYVVHHGGNREAYAHRLVDIAELSSAPIAAAGVGIVSFRSMLSRRVTRILDTSRSLSTRAGNLLLVLVVIGGLFAASMAGLIGLAPSSLQAEADITAADLTSEAIEETDKEKEADAEFDAEPGIELDTATTTIRGTVVDFAGKPLAGATLEVQRWDYGREEQKKPLAEALTNQQGQFEVIYPEWDHVTLVASKQGYGANLLPSHKFKEDEDPTLRLVRDDVPIQGQVVDLEGRPLVGVTVEVGGIFAAEEENLDEWLASIEQGAILWKANNKHFVGRTPQCPKSVPKTLTTDQEGRFTITGIGRERQVRVALTSPEITYQQVSIVTRDMESVVANDGMPHPEWVRKQTIYGANCQILVEPTQPISGVVVDSETQKPMAGVKIESYRMRRRSVSADRLVHTYSDAAGRFLLTGMPKGAGKQIIAVPNDDQPYLMQEFDVPEQSGIQPVEMKLELHRGVWITGRVTDKATGKPIGGHTVQAQFYPYRSNPYASALPEYDSDGNTDGYQDRYRVKEDGSFRLVGVPGKSIVGVQAWNKPYPRGQGSEQIEGADESGHFPTFRVGVSASRLSPTIMQEVEIPEDIESTNVDFALDVGRTITISPVDASGEMLIGVQSAGVRAREQWTTSKASPIDIKALWGSEERTILLHHEERKLGKVLQISAKDSPNEIEALLEPCITVQGQLVDDNGIPLSAAKVRFSPDPGGDFSPELKEISTDSEGRFTQSGVLPGTTYDVMVESIEEGFATLVEDLKVEPGEAIDLGTINVTIEDRPEVMRTQSQTPKPTAKTAPLAENAVGVSREYAGRVVDPAGKPAANAELYFAFHIPEPAGLLTPRWKSLARTDANGDFRFRVSPRDFGIEASSRGFGSGMLVAVKKGYGFAWPASMLHETSGQMLLQAEQNLEKFPEAFREHLRAQLDSKGKPLQLVADEEPIRGTLFDINGQPVAGARLTLLGVWGHQDNNLDSWRSAALKPKADYYTARRATPHGINGTLVRSLVQPATTNAEGRFQLQGIGQGRIAQLLVEGPGIETTKIWARTEAGDKITLLRDRRSPYLGEYTYYPAKLTYVAGPSAPIEGIVRDAKTQEPLAGVTIKSQKRQGEKISGWGQDFVRAVTDNQGRYRLRGMPIGSENEIAAVAPAGDVAYFSSSKNVTTKRPQEVVAVDFDLRSGIWLEGQAVDKQTGNGLSGQLSYYVPPENPEYRFARSLSVDERPRLRSTINGQFRIAVLPGAGYVGFMADEHQKYPRTSHIVQPDGTLEEAESLIQTSPTYLTSSNYHALAKIQPANDTKRIELRLEVDPGQTVTGQVFDPDGAPLQDFDYTGKLGHFATVWDLSQEGRFQLLGYDPTKPRHVFVAHRQRNLAGYLLVDGTAPNDVRIQLQPAGSVTGRLVDEEGTPLANHVIMPWYEASQMKKLSGEQSFVPPLPQKDRLSGNADNETDSEGRFSLQRLVPGITYQLRARDRSQSPLRSGGVFAKVGQVKAGQSLDLGDVTVVNDREEYLAILKAQNEKSLKTKEEPKPDTNDAKVIRGKVTSSEGEPLAGVDVAVVAMRKQPRQGGDLSYEPEVLASGISDEAGDYSLRLPYVNSDSHYRGSLIARKEKMGIAWKRFEPGAGISEGSLVLKAHEPIKGKLVDLEGQPAAGVRLVVQGVHKTQPGRFFSADGASFQSKTDVPAAWVPVVTTNDAGEFTLSGVPPKHGVYLRVEGAPRFAPQFISLNSGQPEQRGEFDGTYRSLVRNAKPGEELILPLAPAQPFEGKITYADTGTPAPNARLTIWASQQEQFGSMVSVASQADEEGRYQVMPNPGIRFGLQAYPPEGMPYFLTKSDDVRWRDGDTRRTVDIALKRGVLVRGQVIDSVTKEPIAQASVQYRAESNNNPNTSDKIVTGWQDIKLTNTKGEFAITVLPGPGSLLVHGPEENYIAQEATDRQLSSGKSGGRRSYFHARQKVNPQENAEPIELTIALIKGATVVGKLVDPVGLPADDVAVISYLKARPTLLNWRNPQHSVFGGKFELSGLAPNETYQVSFLDAQRQLGATVPLKADDPNPTVTLQPCGKAQMRFVDEQGEPVANYRSSVWFIARPGGFPYDNKMSRVGITAADYDYLSNIDRTNYGDNEKTMADDQGKLTLDALIPGATYWMIGTKDGSMAMVRAFIAKPAETIDLGDIEVDRRD